MKKIIITAIVLGLAVPTTSSFAAVKKPTAATAKEGTAAHETKEAKTGTAEKMTSTTKKAKSAKKVAAKKVAKKTAKTM